MSRLIRRHDKLLRQLLTATRERVAAEHNGASRAQIERLAVRERSLRSPVNLTAVPAVMSRVTVSMRAAMIESPGRGWPVGPIATNRSP